MAPTPASLMQRTPDGIGPCDRARALRTRPPSPGRAAGAGSALTAAQVTTLQRRVGNAAVQRLLAPSAGEAAQASDAPHANEPVATQATPAPISRCSIGDATLQRAIGFEFQTGWGIQERQPRKWWQFMNARQYRPYNRQEVVADYGTFRLTADEAQTALGAEIEFVVPHIEEDQRAQMDTALRNLEDLARRLNGYRTRNAFTLNQASGRATESNVEVQPKIKQAGILAANPQVTGGIRLDRIQRLFAELGVTAGAHHQARHDLASTGGGPGLGLAATAVANLTVNGLPASAKCKGLVAMLVTYLKMGRRQVAVGINQPTLNYGKASLTLLARTDYHGMFLLLPGAEQLHLSLHPDEFEDMVLTAAGNLDPAANVIERGIHGVPVNITRTAWLQGIAGGADILKEVTDARLFGFGSLDANTDGVGPALAESGAVLEFRTMGRDVPWTRWRPMGMRIFDYLVALNQ